MKLCGFAALLMASAAGAQAFFQISDISASTTATQAILQYTSPVPQACSLKAADMNRYIVVTGGSQGGGVVTITTRSPHGLTGGAMVYFEGTGVAGWNGWQTVSAVADTTHFSFASAVGGTATTGTVGVLIDDLNPALFSGADQDSRTGNLTSGSHRTFVIGKRTAEVAADGNRYTRALQVNSRHHYTLTCGAQTFDQEFTTQNLPLGDTHNEGLPVDRSHPGQYAYPTVQWTNRAQSLIDPVTGVRSVRAQSPVGTASTVQSFQTAIDHAAAWKTPSGPLGVGGTATFTGPCSSGNCALFLRADSLSLPGGATYTGYYGAGASLDWVTVTLSASSINNGSCSGNDCKISACLTVDGVTCASGTKDITLTTAPASYTVGTTTLMDLWQPSGPPAVAAPDVSQATGTVNYTNATKVVTWASGSKFSIKWGAGSKLTINGTERAIASVQSELSLTLSAPIGGDLSGAAYSANNFGVLVWKKTATADTVTVGYTTFLYGSTVMDTWISASAQLCSPLTVTSGGVAGYDCFIGYEMYWIAVDGSDVRDIGTVGLPDTGGALWSTGGSCGDSNDAVFDPTVDGDTWYCLIPFHPFAPAPWPQQAIIKAHYNGSHAAGTPGVTIPGCNQNGNVPPCITFTPMQPNATDAVSVAGPAFATNYDSSYVASNWLMTGISSEGDILIVTRELYSLDTRAWFYVFTLGDRTPAGTDANSIHAIASASSYRYHPPCTFCGLHSEISPSEGWAWMPLQDLSSRGASYTFGMALTSSLLTTSLSTCPTNPLGVTGTNCTAITTSGEPVSSSFGAGATQVGDLIIVDSELLRIVVKTDANHLTVQRGYMSTTVAAHGGTALTMYCGAVNANGQSAAIWDYRDDPYGQNATGTTILVDLNNFDGHQANGPGVIANSIGTWGRIGDAACPKETLTAWGMCYAVRHGATPLAIINSAFTGVAMNPPFAGVLGLGNPNAVDSHPGPCTNQWCSDGRTYDGGTDNVGIPLGTAGTPFTNVTGQLWALAGGGTNLSPKFLNNFAYVGRSALVDVSGTASTIPTDSTGAYTYCVALHAGECRAGSSFNDVFVNAPYVSYGYCLYAGVANQSDDTNSICIGPLGAYTGNLAQFGITQDSTGTTQRRLGPGFSRWSQQGVFWNMSITPTGQIGFSQVRWLDGVRDENIVTVLPPFATSDSISRNTFVPVHIDNPPTRDINVVVEFGYAENGSADSFFCTSRQETCVAASSTVNQALPFYYAQSETYRGVRCSSGCTVEVPALSQRILYYRWKHLNASGAVVAVSDTRATVTP